MACQVGGMPALVFERGWLRMTDFLYVTLTSYVLFSLIAEGIYALWIARSKTAEERVRRSKSKHENWNSKGRWALLILIVISLIASYAQDS